MDAVPMFERWHWSMGQVEELDFEEFTVLADTVQEMFKRDAEARGK
jgi:hypothetical protein